MSETLPYYCILLVAHCASPTGNYREVGACLDHSAFCVGLPIHVQYLTIVLMV